MSMKVIPTAKIIAASTQGPAFVAVMRVKLPDRDYGRCLQAAGDFAPRSVFASAAGREEMIPSTQSPTSFFQLVGPSMS
jgi:hypothetical protein